MNILITGLNYAPEPIGIGPYTAQLAEFLAARGHAVEVIAGNPYYPDWRLAAGYDPAGSDRVENGVRVIRVRHHIPARPTTAGRLLHYTTFRRNVARAARRVQNPDLVLAIAPSLVAAPVALKIAHRARAISWLHIQDFEVEAAVATGLLPKPLARFANWFERRVIGGFDRVSSIAPAMVGRAIDKGADRATAQEIRNWSEITPARAEQVAALRDELNLPDGLLALYSGSLGRKQGCDLLPRIARRLANRTGLTLLVCGEGPERKVLDDAARDLTNLVVRPLQPRHRLGELLTLADIHLLPQIAGAADLVLPSKLANMLASGRPVVAGAAAGTALAEEVEGCGMVVPPGDARGFAEAIMQMCDDDTKRRAFGAAALERAGRRWSKHTLLARFATSLEQAVQEKRMT